MPVGDAQLESAQLRAVAHPIRLRMLSLLTGADMTAAELGRELNIAHPNASYHLRQLRAAGHIEVVAEELVHGGKAKRYRYVMAEQWRDCQTRMGRPATAEHFALYALMADELRRRSLMLVRGPNNRLTDAELWVDEPVLAEISNRVNQASRDLHQAARPPRTPGTRRVSTTIALFEMDDEL